MHNEFLRAWGDDIGLDRCCVAKARGMEGEE